MSLQYRLDNELVTDWQKNEEDTIAAIKGGNGIEIDGRKIRTEKAQVHRKLSNPLVGKSDLIF